MNNKNIIKTARFYHISGMRFAVCKRGKAGSRRLQTAGVERKEKGRSQLINRFDRVSNR